MARYYNVVYSEYVLKFNWSAESYVIISMSTCTNSANFIMSLTCLVYCGIFAQLYPDLGALLYIT